MEAQAQAATQSISMQTNAPRLPILQAFVAALIDWPEKTAQMFRWLPPLVARLVVGEVFMQSGWGKLQNLPQITENFIGWGIPFPHILAPLVSGVEFVGGLFLILGFLTRWAAPPLVVVMIVAIASAKWADADSLDTLLGFEEVSYMALFGWLAVAGPGPISVDWLLQKWAHRGRSTQKDSRA